MTRSLAQAGWRRSILVVAVAVTILAVVAGPAAAHNTLASTAPAADQTVAQAPDRVVLTFDEPAIAMGTQLVVTGPDGPVQDGAPVLVDDTVTQPLEPGAPAGRYTVTWRVTSADGHPISGTYAFTAGAAGDISPRADRPTADAPAGPTETPMPVDLPTQTPVGLWVVIALVLLAGAGALVWRRRRSSSFDDPTSQE